NLQLLCRDCHSQKTASNFVQLTPDHKRYAEVHARKEQLRSRVMAPSPMRPCDDEQNWKVIFRQLINEQRNKLKTIKEDLGGQTRSGPYVESDEIVREIDQIGELYLQVDGLQMQKQARIDEILSHEIKTTLEEVELEFS